MDTDAASLEGVQECCARAEVAADDDTVNELFADNAVRVFLPLGLQTMQLWTSSGGYGSFAILRPNGVKLHLSSRLVDFINTRDCHETILTSSHPLWSELEGIMRAYYQHFQHQFEGDDSLLHRRWTNLLITRTSTPSGRKSLLLAAEASPSGQLPPSNAAKPSLSLHSALHPQSTRARSQLAPQAVRAVAAALLARGLRGELVEARARADGLADRLDDR